MSSSGRPLHDYWSSAYFEAVRQFGRIQALCLLCNKQLKNTARSRLRLHRNICPVREDAAQFYKLECKTEASSSEQKRRRLSKKLEPKVVIVKGCSSYNCKQENQSNEDATENNEEESLEESLNEEYIQENESSQRELFQIKCVKSQNEIFVNNVEATINQPGCSNANDEENNALNSPNKKLERNEIDEAFAEFFFGCNMPLTVLEVPYFNNFIKALNNSYSIPSKNYLLSTLLDKVHDKYDSGPEEISEIETNSVLILSGFNHSNGVVACVQTEDGTRHFLNFWDFDGEINGNTETSPEELNGRLDRVTEILEDCKEIAKTSFNTKLYAAIFDGLEISTSLGSLWCTTCNVREASLLAQDVIDPQLIGNVVEILRTFENPELEAELRQNDECRIVYPWAGNWFTYKDTLNCLIKNYKTICSIISSKKDKIMEGVHDLVSNENFINEVRVYAEALDSICSLLYKCQEKKTTLSEATEHWLSLKLPEKFQDYLEARKKAALSPCALAANFVDPRYRGKLLSEEHLDLIEDFFLEYLTAQGLDDLFVFKSNSGIFKILWDKHITTPTTFWGLAERKHPEFSKLASSLLKIPASSWELEKLYSDFIKVQMPLRNMLDLEKLRKLIKTYFNLRLKDSDSE